MESQLLGIDSLLSQAQTQLLLGASATADALIAQARAIIECLTDD